VSRYKYHRDTFKLEKMKKIFKHELCEIAIPVNSTSTRFNFPDLPNLKGTNLFGLQTYTVDMLPVSPLSGNALPTRTQMLTQCFITLIDYNGFEFLKQAPAVLFNTIVFDLNTSTNLRDENAKVFNGQKVNWAKSYVQFTTAPGGASALGVLFSINYATMKRTPDGKTVIV
jgi:hypothetical protein